ncbi:hypothetical protein AF332_08670 [Sporosarcina globispora]|uniref:Lipoprotein n=1 Tax=Sporosarcina globispora TaxID=1459 RepID=A0A0M0GBR6_SPOGL|nr:hypothetical protein [Sporosarcina globispora]KON86871.1 hypothetical protein AF332_08670 [Sporosarcina globispora]
MKPNYRPFLLLIFAAIFTITGCSKNEGSSEETTNSTEQECVSWFLLWAANRMKVSTPRPAGAGMPPAAMKTFFEREWQGITKGNVSQSINLLTSISIIN